MDLKRSGGPRKFQNGMRGLFFDLLEDVQQGSGSACGSFVQLGQDWPLQKGSQQQTTFSEGEQNEKAIC